MTTRLWTASWSARLLRRSERRLDGTAPEADPVGRLLAEAGRLHDGPVNGEDVALAQFRADHRPAAARPAALPTLPFARSTPVRTFTLRRLLAAKVLAIGIATVTVGGVAFAASLDVLKLPFQPASSTLVASASPAGRSGNAGGTGATGAGAAQNNSDSDTVTSTVRPAPAATAHPSPTGSAGHATAGDDTPKADDRTRGVPGIGDAKTSTGAKVRLAIACQFWRSDPRRDAVRAKVTAELTKAAGGADAILAFCRKITTELCAQWPATLARGANADAAADVVTDTTSARIAERCPFDLDRKVIVPKPPVPMPPITVPPITIEPMPIPKPWPTLTLTAAPGPATRY